MTSDISEQFLTYLLLHDLRDKEEQEENDVPPLSLEEQRAAHKISSAILEEEYNQWQAIRLFHQKQGQKLRRAKQQQNTQKREVSLSEATLLKLRQQQCAATAFCCKEKDDILERKFCRWKRRHNTREKVNEAMFATIPPIEAVKLGIKELSCCWCCEYNSSGSDTMASKEKAK